MQLKQIYKALPWALATLLCGQTITTDVFAQDDPTVLPKLTFAKISGAPKLGTPKLVFGDTKPVMSEGMGWAAPAFFDIDGDGHKDLLIGEFGSGLEDRGMPVGNFVRMYRNTGSAEQPKFSDVYSYVRPAERYSTGTPLSIYTWCCIGFTPQVVDLDNDGYADLVTGAYNPGVVTWFKGTADGFMNGEQLPQFSDPYNGGERWDYTLPRADPKSSEYWNYSAVAFGDFDGKGLQDMIVGGSALRISKNVGTKVKPSFGKRELLLDIHGKPLRLIPESDTLRNMAGEPYYGNCMVPTVADWDGDGVLDLFVTDAYVSSRSEAVTFFRGLRTAQGLRFEPGIPLFTAAGAQKAMPGSWLRVHVTDWNNDGVLDVIIGTSVVNLDGHFNRRLSWEWEVDNDIVKQYSAYYSEDFKRIIEEQLHHADSLKMTMNNMSDEELNKKGYTNRTMLIKNYYGKGNYKNLAHQGYIYVLLGKKEEYE